jgi:hypothetical protein
MVVSYMYMHASLYEEAVCLITRNLCSYPIKPCLAKIIPTTTILVAMASQSFPS